MTTGMLLCRPVPLVVNRSFNLVALLLQKRGCASDHELQVLNVQKAFKSAPCHKTYVVSARRSWVCCMGRARLPEFSPSTKYPQISETTERGGTEQPHCEFCIRIECDVTPIHQGDCWMQRWIPRLTSQTVEPTAVLKIFNLTTASENRPGYLENASESVSGIILVTQFNLYR